MKVDLVRIGNSRGIRIPRAVIEQCGFGDTVELRVERDHLVISPERHVREGWRNAFASAGAPVADELLLDSVEPSTFDQDEWEW
jgi:antitoxin MazE